MRIFAIDDEIGALGLLEDAIKDVLPKEEIFTFHFASEMLKKATELPPDIAFLDIEIPEISGLEIAQKLRALNNKINVIFVTGYNQYALEALKQYASDYITKPVSAKAIKRAMENLRYPIEEKKKISIKAFGNFAVFFNDVGINFRLEKSKELLAYLVDRKGAPVNRREVASVLYEEGNFDRNEQKSLSRVASWLKEDLENNGIVGFFKNESGNYSIDKSMCDCDYFDFENGKTQLYHGEYMEQYSWGEDKKGIFEEIL